MKSITDLPQFEKHFDKRKNAKHPVFKEQDTVCDSLDRLYEEGKL